MGGWGRRETRVVEACLVLVMKSSLFILRRQSVSGRAWGLRCSTALPVCEVCRKRLHSAAFMRPSSRLPQLNDTKSPSLRQTATIMSLLLVLALQKNLWGKTSLVLTPAILYNYELYCCLPSLIVVVGAQEGWWYIGGCTSEVTPTFNTHVFVCIYSLHPFVNSHMNMHLWT